MKKILLIILSFISSTMIISQNKSTCSNIQNTFFAHPIYSDSVYEVNYEWKGKVIELVTFDIANDSKIPHTYFLVEVLENDDLKLDDYVIISFFGGYVGDSLFLLENMSYPEEDTTYNFYNSKLFTYDNYQFLVIEAPHQMIEEMIYTPLSWGPPEDSDNPGGGSGVPYYNISFQTASVVANDKIIFEYLDIYKDFPRFYRFTVTHSFILAAATFGNTDTELTLYNSSETQIAFNDNAISTEINAGLLIENLNPGTYYIKVSRKNSGPAEFITLHLERTNYEIIVAPDGPQKTVNSANQVVYKDSTNMYESEITYASNIWNTLVNNKIVPSTSSLSKTVEITLIYNYNSDIVAEYIYGPNGTALIELNQVIFIQHYSGPNNINFRIHIITHELGHALGIDHAVNSRNIMHTNVQKRVAFGTLDVIYFNQKAR